MPDRDPYRPRFHPERSLYDAYVAEAAKRGDRLPKESLEREIEAVTAAAKVNARRLGLIVPSKEQVAKAGRLAMGHTDYGARWARHVVRIMRGKG